MSGINFVPFEQKEHLELLKNWLMNDHVQEFWRDLAQEEEVAFDFLAQLKMRGVQSYLATVDGKPMGYIQFYEISQESDVWAGKKPENVYEIELLIGDPSHLGQGLATKLIEGFVHFMKETVDLSNIVVDSRSSNAKALKAFKKVGFQEIMKLNISDHETVLLKLSKSN